MKREIITFGSFFEDFLTSLDEKLVRKIDYILALLEQEQRLDTDVVKHIQDGLYELRILYNSSCYRVFFCFDENRIVVLFNGFQKKTQKTPRREIQKALKIKKLYYESKRTNSKL